MPVFAKYDGVDSECEETSPELSLSSGDEFSKSAIGGGANDIIRGSDGSDVIRLSTSDGGFCVDDDGSFADGAPSKDSVLDSGNDTIFGGSGDDNIDDEDILFLDPDGEAFEGGYCVDHDPDNEMSFDLCDPIFRKLETSEQSQKDFNADSPGDEGVLQKDSGDAHLDYLVITMEF